MSFKKRITENWHDLGCSSGGCHLGHQGGMHTNGSCKCVPLKNMTMEQAINIREALDWWRKKALQIAEDADLEIQNLYEDLAEEDH